MIKILSIETSTTVCSVCISVDGVPLAYQKMFLEKSHSSLLTVIIDQLMKQVDLSMNDLDAIAVSKGPGSYTGLRIGVSTAKGLCYALDKPLIAINTLLAMAHEVNQANHSKLLLCPMIDARRMEVYTAIFDHKLNQIEATNAKVLDGDSFQGTLEQGQALFFGNGADKFKDFRAEEANIVLIENISPSASSIGSLAFEAYQRNEFEDLAYFEPYYLKDFIATKPKKLL